MLTLIDIAVIVFAFTLSLQIDWKSDLIDWVDTMLVIHFISSLHEDVRHANHCRLPDVLLIENEHRSILALSRTCILRGQQNNTATGGCVWYRRIESPICFVNTHYFVYIYNTWYSAVYSTAVGGPTIRIHTGSIPGLRQWTKKQVLFLFQPLSNLTPLLIRVEYYLGVGADLPRRDNLPMLLVLQTAPAASKVIYVLCFDFSKYVYILTLFPIGRGISLYSFIFLLSWVDLHL